MTNAAGTAADLLAGFPPALREAGLAVDPGAAADFLRAVRLCRLSGIADLERIGRVTLTNGPHDFPIYHEIFDAWFGGGTSPGRVCDPEQEDGPRAEQAGSSEILLQQAGGAVAGRAAAEDMAWGRKTFGRLAPDPRELARLERALDLLPTLERRAWRPSPAGRRIDLSRTMRAALRTFGEALRLFRSARPRRQRKLLLLVDVSGSMKAQSEAYLRFAHLATRRARRVETFCFGTRLSRVTATLRHRDSGEALSRLAGIVHDFDGGTQIGRSLQEFLSVSRHAALVRGSVTIVLSDGLERGEPSAMIHAVDRLARLSHRLVWATPLAADPNYRPATRGMAGIMPLLDGLFDGGGLPALERMLHALGRIERMARGQAARSFARSG
ncbi:MAG TPA: VWA domain-containing protein [Rhizobiaceae bacterium]|nr:VWA domain-containing protein [Rhizobiaceae bacterium]